MSSNDAVQPVDEKSTASEEVDQWIVNIEAEIQGHDTEEIPPTRPPIEEIPSIYGKWKCLDDFGDVMSFLPETNRWQFVAFMKRAFDLKVREYLEELQTNEDKIWRYYCGVDEQFRAENSKGFIEHLLINSCFLIFALFTLTQKYGRPDIFLFRSAANDDKKMRTFNEYKNLEKFILGEQIGIECYMLIMDYQIPWFVVEALYKKHSNFSSMLNTPIHELVISMFKSSHPEVHKSKLHNNIITVSEDGFQHVLHIFHWSRTPKGKFHETNSGFKMKVFDNMPSVTNMQLSATVFNKHVASGFDVTFYERILSGVLQLPPWLYFLDKHEIYRNLLAFERGYSMVCGLSVTAYVACIVNLVQTEEDVTLLRAKHIIPRLGDEKDFLSSLQRYKTIVLSNDIPVSDDLIELALKMRSHISKRSSIKKYYADFKRRYCSNPWITLSVVGGMLLFLLTFIQTVLSFIQTKYSVLSYKKQ